MTTVREIGPGSERRGDQLIALWLFACAAMILLMVVIGGVTRLTESGLSITEWQPLTGVVPPLKEVEWQRSFTAYRQIPEYQRLHPNMTLAEYKAIYWWEFIHRLWGRLIGIAFAVPLVVFFLRRRIPRGLTPWLLLLLILGGLQGALGWYMVESGLSLRTQVSQYRLAAHFAGAAALYAALLWTGLTLVRSPPQHRHGGTPLRPWLVAWLGLLALTMIAGVFVAGLDAGLIYNSFPWMGEGLVPPDYDAAGPSFWTNAFENPSAAQFHHRLLAIATILGILALWLKARRLDLPLPARRTLTALALAAVAQLGLGILTLLLVVPIPIAALHQAGAMVLLTLGIWTVIELRDPPRLAQPDAAY